MKYTFQLEIEGEDFSRCPSETLAAVWLLQRRADHVDRPADYEVLQHLMRREMASRWLATLAIYSDNLAAMIRLVARMGAAWPPITATNTAALRSTSDETLALLWMMADKQGDSIDPECLAAVLAEVADRWVSTLLLSAVETAPGCWGRPSITQSGEAAV